MQAREDKDSGSCTSGTCMLIYRIQGRGTLMLWPWSAMASAMSASNPGRSLHCTTSQVTCPPAASTSPMPAPGPCASCVRSATGAADAAGGCAGSRCACSRKNFASLCRAVLVFAYLTQACAREAYAYLVTLEPAVLYFLNIRVVHTLTCTYLQTTGTEHRTVKNRCAMNTSVLCSVVQSLE